MDGWQNGGDRLAPRASLLPLRNDPIAYFTLMRRNDNRAVTFDEVTLDPVKRTSYFRLDRTT
jgi:hypothetical protein